MNKEIKCDEYLNETPENYIDYMRYSLALKLKDDPEYFHILNEIFGLKENYHFSDNK
jgi:hypothetical protein